MQGAFFVFKAFFSAKLKRRHAARHVAIAGRFSNIAHYIAAAHPVRCPCRKRTWSGCHLAL